MYLALGFLGILMHNFMKMDDLNRKQNGEFKYFEYLKIEKFSILLSICLVIVCIMVSQEIKELANVGKWMGLAFVAIGYMAQSIIVKYSGKAEKIINDKTQ